MKKFFAILAVLSFLMIPMASMAAMQMTSDADLATITGQSGVSIEISALDLSLKIGNLVYGDLNGYGLNTEYGNAGYVNVTFVPVAMHVGVSSIAMDIDVGTKTFAAITNGDNPYTVATVETDYTTTAAITRTAIQIKAVVQNITVDAVEFYVNLDGTNAITTDYIAGMTAKAGGGTYMDGVGAYALTSTGALKAALVEKNIGIVGVSGINLTINTPVTITISAH